MRETWPDAHIEVQLGALGPLVDLLTPNAEVRIEPLWIARAKGVLASVAREAPAFALRAPRRLSASRRYDFVYINTIAVLEYLLPTLLNGRNTVLHVREIVPNSIAGHVMKALVVRSRATKIYNSHATAKSFGGVRPGRDSVVYNAIYGPSTVQYPQGGSTLDLLCIGRISDWKGQDLAIEAVSLLPESIKARVRLRIVGSAFDGREDIEEGLRRSIARYQLEHIVTLEPFTVDAQPEFARASAVVVPSRRPEPFGRVAVEALSHGRPVVAAAHGGLPEIVEHGQSGLLVAPNDAQALSRAIRHLVEQSGELQRLAVGARRRFEDSFAPEVVTASFVAAISQALAQH